VGAISDHGALMIGGFLGTLISLERAVALGRGWAYVAPLLTGLGGLGILLGGFAVAKGAIVVGSFIFVGVSLAIVIQQPASHTGTMMLGAATFAVGNGLWWINRPVFELVWWWVAFLLLTIAGERLELSRLVWRPRWAGPAFVAAIAVVLAGVVASTWSRQIGTRVTGCGILALACWLGLHDAARRTVRQHGLARYVAVCLLSGYVWLAVSAILLIGYGPVTAGAPYDAVLHAFFIGFVFSMIFGHAPIIFPAVLHLAVHYRPSFYLPLALLHISLLARVIGDIGGFSEARAWGGALNAIAIVLFFGTIVFSGQIANRLGGRAR